MSQPVYDVVVVGRTLATFPTLQEAQAYTKSHELKHYEIWRYQPSSNVVVESL